MAIEREACQKCTVLTKAELQQHQGADFDKAYLGHQIGGHVGMIAKLETFQRHASPELAQVMSKSLATAQEHLQMAKDLCNELKGEQRQPARDTK
jgi:predicted outer membrane protein